MTIKLNKIIIKKPINIEKLDKQIPDEKRNSKDLFHKELSRIFIIFNDLQEQKAMN
ncbi:MAG: hypothetical protein ACTSUN_07025 [Promethearchaeota archaeon]